MMKELRKEHFCFGAILAAIMEYNPDTSLVLLEPSTEKRSIYKIQTNTSKECVIFFKYAFEKTENSQSWLFQFSDEDKIFLKQQHENKIPVFIYLLCGVKTLMKSEIAVLRYEEYLEVEHKPSFTINLNKKKQRNQFFDLYRTKSPKDALNIPRNRVEKTFDELIDDIIKDTGNYYCPHCGGIVGR